MKKQYKYYIQTFGCQMNHNDSERISAFLNSLSFENVEKPEQADLLIVNTCSVRQSAEDRVFGMIKNWQKLRDKNPNLIIAITGCMPGRDKDDKIKNKIPGVDLWFGIDALPQLPKWLFGLGLKHTPNSFLEGATKSKFFFKKDKQTSQSNLFLKSLSRINFRKSGEALGDYLQINPERENKFQVFISIQTGCNNFCTYCVVPYARGQERNRNIKDILLEIKKAIAEGAKEITLLGQVVNNYQAKDKENFSQNNPFVIRGYGKMDELLSQTKQSEIDDSLLLSYEPSDPSTLVGMTNTMLSSRAKQSEVEGTLSSLSTLTDSTEITIKDSFAALLWEINQIPGEFRIHFTAPDPQYFSDEQVEALKLPKQVNFLHLPAQSGDNEILKKMNRHYTREEYINLIKRIRQVKPDITLATDIIVGFCGEGDLQFQNTVDLYKQCDFDISYHAMYSERSGTVAAKVFKDDVLQTEKKNRWNVLQELMVARTFEKNQKYQDQVVRVLVDKFEDGICSGNTDEMKLCQFSGTEEMIGTFQKIKITQCLTWVLKGKIQS